MLSAEDIDKFLEEHDVWGAHHQRTDGYDCITLEGDLEKHKALFARVASMEFEGVLVGIGTDRGKPVPQLWFRRD